MNPSSMPAHMPPANMSTSIAPAFASCARGLEPLLAIELNQLGASSCQENPGGVSFTADWPTLLKLNLWSRLAGRILMQVGRISYNNEHSLYQGVKRLPWFDWFDVHKLLRVDVNDIGTQLPNLRFAQLRIKDAICDAFLDQLNQRPSIDTYQPDVRVVAALAADHALIYLDLSGENLFKRGWREEKGDASLKENLAAGLWQFAWSLSYQSSPSQQSHHQDQLKLPSEQTQNLSSSGEVLWQKVPHFFDLANHSLNLLDPFCGSGTIPIEVAHALMDLAPGWQRQFAFAHLKTMSSDKHSPSVWKSLKDDASSRREQGLERCLKAGHEGRLKLIGHDITRKLIDIARENAERAGFEALLKADILMFKPLDARQLQASSALDFTSESVEPAYRHQLILTNPPYGQRLQVKGRRQTSSPDHSEGEQASRHHDDLSAPTDIDTDQAAYLELFRELGDQFKQHFAGWHSFIFSGDLQLKQALGLSPRRKIPLMNGAIECRLFYIPLNAGKYRPRSIQA